MRANPRILVIQTLLIGGLATMVGNQWVVRPQHLAAAQAEREVAEARELLTLQRRLATQLPQVLAQRSRLPERQTLEPMVGELAKWAETAGVRLTNIEPTLPQTKAEVTRLAVSLQFESGYHELGSFVSLIERSPQYLRVDALQMQPVSGQTDKQPGSLRGTMVVSTFYLAPL